MAVFAEDKSGRVTPHISHQRHQVLPDKTLATESMSSSKLDLTIKFEALQHLWALGMLRWKIPKDCGVISINITKTKIKK